MVKKLFFALSILLILIVSLACVLFLSEYFRDTDEFEFLAISLILCVLTVALIVSFILDFIVGRKEFIFKNGEILVGRKGKIISTIPKEEIKAVVFTYDAVDKGLCYLSFKHGKKTYRFPLKKKSTRSCELFFNGMDVTKKDNTAGYILQMILDVFSI